MIYKFKFQPISTEVLKYVSMSILPIAIAKLKFIMHISKTFAIYFIPTYKFIYYATFLFI